MFKRFLRIALLTAFAVTHGTAAWAGPGSGTAAITPAAPVSAGSPGTWGIVYTAAENMSGGQVRITIPAGWTAPQSTQSTSPGYVTVSTDEAGGNPLLSVGGQVVTIDVDTLSAGNTVTLVYGDDAGGANPGARATAATTAGSYPFAVASDPSGTSPAAIASSPSLSVVAAAAAYLEVVPGDTTVTAGDFAPYRVLVRDSYGNLAPVPENRTVGLYPSHGQFFTPLNHATPVTQVTITTGTSSVRIDYRPTVATGASPLPPPHSLTVLTNDGKFPVLGGSESVNVVPAALSTAVSTIGATSPVTANGVAQSTVTVTSKDAYGNVREGDTVVLAVTGSAVKAGPGGPTGSDGQATGVVTDTVAETVTVSATINAQALASTAPVTFVAGPVSASASTVDATTPVVANGVATSTITVTAKDAFGNPVSGQSVTLSVAPPGGGAVLTQPGGVTNASGVATGTLASTTTGPRTVTAVVGATSVTDDAVVVFNSGPVASFTWTGVDGAATAGTFEFATLTAKDAQGNVVTGYTGTVNLSTTSGGVGNGVVEWTAPDAQGVITNLIDDNATYQFAPADNGVATLRVTNTRAESYQLMAQDGAANGTSAAIVVAPNTADKIQLVAGNGQTATVNTAVSTHPTVHVVDAYDNSVGGVTVKFRVVGGGGSVDVTSGGAVDSTGVTAADGIIDCDVWRLGTTAGLNRLRALITTGSVQSVDFTATGTAGPGANLDLTPNSKNVTQGTFEVVTATLTDGFGNVKNGEVVTIAITDAPNGSLALNPADPNPTSTINASTRSGTTDANGRITVRYVAPATAPTSDTVDASTALVPQSSVVDAVYTTTASGATNLRITFVGPSTRPAGQAAQLLIEAVDGGGNVDNGNAATVDLTPEGGSGLEFSLTDFGATVTQVTLAAGAGTVYARGTLAGTWDIGVSSGGLGGDSKEMTVTDTGVIDHYAVGTVASVVAGITFNVSIEARDAYDNRVVGASNAVNLTAIDDVNPTPAQSTLQVGNATLASGQAVVGESYTTAEAIRVKVDGSGKEGTSGVLTVSAAAAHRIAKVSGDAGNVVAGSGQALSVQVFDSYDNPVANETVTFLVLAGGGFVAPPTITTDAGGIAGATLTTGTVKGSNTLKATILDENPAGLERVDFLVTTVAGPIANYLVTPAKTNPVAHEDVAITVTARDANGNVRSQDSSTNITLSKTGSAVLGATSGTLSAGTFATTVHDDVVESFTVGAQTQGGGPSGTSPSIVVSNAGAYQVVKVSGDASGVTAGGTQPLVVLVRDPYLNPVPDALVTFSIASAPDGSAFLQDAVGDPNDGITTTDGAGQAQLTLHTALTAGSNQVNAQILDGVPLALERVTFTVSTISGGATHLRITFLGPATAAAGQSFSFKVDALDASDNLDTSNTSLVTLAPEGGSALLFSLTDFGATTTTFNLQSGTRTLYGRGTTAGNWDIAASAGGLTGDTDAVTITHTGVVASYAVTAADSALAGAAFTVSIEARDTYGNQVTSAGNVVNLEAIDDVSPTPTGTNLSVAQATLVSGAVVVNESYPRAELIRVRVRDASLFEGISNVVKIKPAAAYRVANQAGDGSGVVAGTTRLLTARVLDQFDNPVTGQLVSFAAVSGGGSVAPPSGTTNSAGDVSTTLTTGTAVGTNVARATILDGIPPALETASFTVTTVAGAIANYEVTTGKTSLVANEITSVTVKARDASGNYRTQDNSTLITLSHTGDAALGATTGTLSGGQFATTVSDTTAESFTVSAQTQGGGPSGTSPSVTVTNGPAYRVVYVSGSSPPSVPVGFVQPLRTEVRDQWSNTVPGAVVTYLVQNSPVPNSFLGDAVGDTADGISLSQANGRAVVRLHTSPTAGTSTVTATILDGTPAGRERVTFNVTTTAGAIDHYTVQMNATSTTAGVSKNATVTAFDINNNPVDDDVTQVDLSGDPGIGLVFGADPVTLANGAATTSVTANQVQTYRVRASTLGSPGVTGLGPDVDVVPAAPAGTITATATQNTITANGTSTTTITSGVIRDAFSNQVPAGLSVNVSANLGGVIVGGSPKTVGVDGRIVFELRSSTTVGTCTVTMTSATGTASGTIDIAFAPKPALACDTPPSPSIVVPGSSVSFTVVADNAATTAVDLTTATALTFADGTHVFSANLAGPQSIPGNGSTPLVFSSASIDPAFVTATYAPTATLIGMDAYSSPVNVACVLPAASLLVTSIEITGIVPASGVLSRGQSSTVAVTIKNNGTQNATIDDVDLVFIPSDLFIIGEAPELGAVLGPGASGAFNVPITVQAGATVGSYNIDAVASGTVSTLSVTDNSVAPHPLASLQVTAAANLAYEAGTMTPTVVSRGGTYAFALTIRNLGGGLVVLDSTSTRITFTDGVRTYSAAPAQPYAVAGGGATQSMVFRPRAVPAAFTPGPYAVTLDVHGTENGADFNQNVPVTGSPVAVVTPAVIVEAPGNSLQPDQVSKTTTVAFTVQLQNNGGATVSLTPQTTTIAFAAGAYTAALDALGPTTLPPGTTTLQFVGTQVSGAIASNTYFPQVQLNGLENGLAFSQSIALSDGVIVQNAPVIAILGIFPSQPQFTQDQAKPIKVRMLVSNSGGANVNFTSASLRFIHAGQDRTNQFVIPAPTAFARGNPLAGGETDTVVFNVSDNPGNSTTPGNMTIEGSLQVLDVNTSQPVLADTDFGGKGSLQVMTPAAITFDAVIASQAKVTQSMTRVFQVRAAARNTGGSDVALTLTGPTTRLVFSPSPGWVASVRPALAGGGTLLSAGEVDTLVFDVTTTGSTAGTTAIDVVTAGVETNSGRNVPGSASGQESVLVQSPGTIQVASVVPSRASITSGAVVPWTVTVTLTNSGQSDVDLALGGAVGLSFQNATTPPGFTVPGSLAGGGTVLSGGETDQLVIPLTDAGTYGSFGSKSIGVDVDGTEVNSGAARNGVGSGSVTVQQTPDASFVSLTPGTVSKLTSVAFSVTVQNPVSPNGATLTLDRATSRLRFGSGQFNVGLTQASPVDVAAGAQVTLLFTGAVVGAGIPTGVQADAQLELHWTHNGATGTRTINLPAAITVQNAPSLGILSMRSSRATVTRGQGGPWTVTMVLRNSGGAAVDLDLAPGSTRLGFKVLASGAVVTGEYTVQSPLALETAGGTVLAGGATDSLVFDVTQAGITTGSIILNGFVRGIDQNSSDVLTDDTTDGGSGSFVLQLPGALSILAVTPAQATATVGQTTKSYTVRMAVRNTGGAAIDVSLLPANSFLTFPTTSGWAVNAATMPGGVTLVGGETDTLRFLVTTTGGPAGAATIGGTVGGFENNTGSVRIDDTTSGGSGSITLQTPASLLVDSVTPSQPSVTTGTALGWNTTVALHNAGQSAARLDLPAGFSIGIQDAVGGTTVFVKPVDLEEGGVVLAGGASGTLVARANNTGSFSSLGTKSLDVSIGAVETNSNRALSAPGSGSILVQSSPDLVVTDVRPAVVTSGSVVDFEVDVQNPAATAATVKLERGVTRAHFASNAFSAFLDLASPDSIVGGATETLRFEGKIIPTSIAVGPYSFDVDFAYAANGIDRTESESGSVAVQAAPQLFIQQIAVSQPTVTAGQTADWTATMTVVNNGSADIDLDLSPAKTFLTFIGPDAQPDPSYIVNAPVMATGDDILVPTETGQIVFTVTQTGVKTGNIVISGKVEGRDLNQLSIVTDDTFDGGRGGVVVQAASSISVTAIHPSQPEVTAGQNGWAVRVLLANTGGADVAIDLAGASIAFSSPGPGWSVGAATLLGGGNVLEGGAVDSLLFPINTTGTTAGIRRIDATVPWTETNSSVTGSATTVSSGFGQVVVESPAVLRVTTTTASAPNPAEVNVNQAFSVVIQIQNTGQADAHDVLPGLARSGASVIAPISPIANVAAGQVVSYPLAVTAAAAPNPAETFTSTLVSAHDENSGQTGLVTIQNPPLDATATVAIQTPAVVDITAVRPSQSSVTRGQANPWSVIVALRNTGQADADLTPPAAGDLAFSIGGATKIDYVVQPPARFGSGTGGWRLAGGVTDSLVYDIVSTGNDPGTLDIALGVAGSDRNDPARTVNDTGQTSVDVQDVAGLFIASAVPVGTFNHATANRDTVNTSFGYEIHVTVQNSGGEDVDSVRVSLTRDGNPGDGVSAIAPASLRRESIAAAASREFIFRVTSPATTAVLETFTAGILPGVVSHNSGQTVVPQAPLDNLHQVVTQTRANLSTNLVISAPPGSTGGVVSTNQLFTLAARVSNLGQAVLSGPAEVTLTVPAGFSVQEALTRAFVADDSVKWTVTAPGAPQPAANFLCAITTTPKDVNTDATAFVSKASDTESVTVGSGGTLTNPTVALTAPAGAADDTLSVSQGFTLRATVAASRIRSLVATLSVPGGFSVVGSPVRNLGDAAGARQVNYSLIAPAAPTALADLFVTFAAVDTITGDPVPSVADTVAVAVVPGAALSVSASVTAPPDAIDNTVAIGTPFTVTSAVQNAAGGAGIANPGTLTIALPAGYALAGGETAAKPFTIGAPVSWVVNAPTQPSGPDQMGVSISAVPPDENSGQPAQVTNGTANIAMVTEGAAVAVGDVSDDLDVGTGVAPGGATDLDLLAFEIAYNVSDPTVGPAEIDTIAVTIDGGDGRPLGPTVVAQTLARLEIDLGGAQPYEVMNPTTNPIVVSLVAGGADRTVAPNGSVNAIVSLDLDASPRATEIRARIRGGGMIVRDPGSGQRLGVTDAQGRPLDGQIRSAPLVILSASFEEYAHNYPNPFRAGSGETRIAYFLDAPATVTVKIYAMTGGLVYEESIPSSDPRAQSGPRETTWDGRNLSGEVVRNGIYICDLKAGARSARFRIAVAK